MELPFFEVEYFADQAGSVYLCVGGSGADFYDFFSYRHIKSLTHKI